VEQERFSKGKTESRISAIVDTFEVSRKNEPAIPTLRALSLMGFPTAALIFSTIFLILTALWEFEINQEKAGHHPPTQPVQRVSEQVIERGLVARKPFRQSARGPGESL
jgi:hypothetical protein